MKKIIITSLLIIAGFVGTTEQANAQNISPQLAEQVSDMLIQAQSFLDNAVLRPVVLQIINQARLILEQYTVLELTDDYMFEDQDEFLALYTVRDLELSAVEGGEDDVDFEAWDLFVKSADSEILNTYLKHFAVYEDNSDTVAYVEESEADETWLLAVNLGGVLLDSEEDLFDATSTMIHEFAHILTLNNGQLPKISESLCKTNYTSEGCPKASSYYQEFIDEFWNSLDLDFTESLHELGEDEALEEIEEWYEERPEDFVNDYSATNPGEDIAESFMYFVFKDKQVNFSGQAEEKINFFYRYPELTELRNVMRSRLHYVIVNSKFSLPE